MAAVQKYSFDLSFDKPTPAQIARRRAEEAARLQAEIDARDAAAAASAAMTEPAPPPEPTFSAAELEAAERRGYEQGLDAGERTALSAIEARLAATSENLGFALKDIAREQRGAIAGIESQAAELVLLCVRKLFPLCSSLAGTQEIEGLIRTAFGQALHEPRIVIRCAADLREALEPRIAESAALAGFEGRLTVIGDPLMEAADVRAEWAAGGMERRTAEFLQAVEDAVRRLFPTPAVAAVDASVTALSIDATPEAEAGPDTGPEEKLG